MAEYQKPNARRASWQLVNTLGPYLAIWVLMYFTLSVSWWLTIPLAILAGGLIVRVFIIFHDCGHGSFFKSGRANDFWGFVTGLLSFTPYHHWKWEHSVHHATTGHLERRGVGDIWTMTVKEYLESSRWKRFSYQFGAEPLCSLRDRAIVSLSGPASHPITSGESSRQGIRLDHESRTDRDGYRLE